MVSLLNVHLPVLMQLNRAEGGTLLPWPNGSLLSGKLMPAAEGAGAMLMLGNYRVRVEVPPNTPMGNIWLQLLQREMPGQFRLLSDRQAIALIAEMLKNPAQAEGLKNKPSQEQNMKQAGGQQEWSKLQSDTLPFAVEMHGERLLLLDKHDGGAQGLLQKDEGQDSFMLSGRLDLDNLGGLAFSLEGSGEGAWKVHLHLADPSLKKDVEQLFLAWLEQQSESVAKLEGTVFDTIPETLGRSSTREA